jgi:DNA repair protein SbcD/Mre11
MPAIRRSPSPGSSGIVKKGQGNRAAHRMQPGVGMRLLHAADVHLDADYTSFGALAQHRAQEVVDAFRRLPDAAAEARADAVLIAGDLFDGPDVSPATMSAVREVLGRFVDLCIPLFLVPGNHDGISLKLSPYRELARGPRVVVQNGEDVGGRRWTVADEAGRRLAAKHSIYILARPHLGEPVSVETESGPLHVYGAAFDRAECPDPVATFQRHPGDGVHVVLLHAYVHGAGRWRATRNALTVGLEALELLPVDYIALGDQHRPVLPDQFDGFPACYPGSFAATSLTETGPRGYVIVDVDPGQPPRIRHRDAGVTPTIALDADVSSCQDDDQVAELAAGMVPERTVPFIRLVGQPAFPMDADAVAARLIDRFGHAAVVDETHYYAAERLDELAAADTVVGHVIRQGRERIAAAGTEPERERAQRALRVVLRALEVA